MVLIDAKSQAVAVQNSTFSGNKAVAGAVGFLRGWSGRAVLPSCEDCFVSDNNVSAWGTGVFSNEVASTSLSVTPEAVGSGSFVNIVVVALDGARAHSCTLRIQPLLPACAHFDGGKETKSTPDGGLLCSLTFSSACRLQPSRDEPPWGHRLCVSVFVCSNQSVLLGTTTAFMDSPQVTFQVKVIGEKGKYDVSAELAISAQHRDLMRGSLIRSAVATVVRCFPSSLPPRWWLSHVGPRAHKRGSLAHAINCCSLLLRCRKWSSARRPRSSTRQQRRAGAFPTAARTRTTSARAPTASPSATIPPPGRPTRPVRARCARL